MERAGRIWGKKALPGWQIGEDLSWPLTVALYVREALGLPATGPFFTPPLVPGVPEHIPVTGPGLDIGLADEWSAWFSGLLADPRVIPWGGSMDYFSLDLRDPVFRDMVARYFEAAVAAADIAHEDYAAHFHISIKTEGAYLGKLVRSVEKELGHTAAPFSLTLRILPVEGFWLHRTAPGEVLMSEPARRDPDHLHRLLVPIIRELA